MTAIERLQKTGIRRVGSPKAGFRYRTPEGARPPEAQLERIRSLVLPPAWTDVFVSPSASSPIQAIGRDRAGRWQYVYSEAHAKRREEKKRERLLAFLESLPRLRARIARDLSGEGLTRERVLAAMVRLLLRGYVRPGSQKYARENGTYGLSTLRRRHVRVQGSRILLSYPGKSGKFQTREIEDPDSAQVLRALLRERGRDVWFYRTETGERVKVRRRHLNAYLAEFNGGRFSAKDFRTWAGTLFGACALARIGCPTPSSARALRRAVAQAMKETAALLGNTPAVCRASYVSPVVLEAFAKGRILEDPPLLAALQRGSSRTMARVEKQLIRMLGNGSRARAAALTHAGRAAA
jgi:DNA topoisomerase-1